MRFMHLADVHLGASPDYEFSWARDRGRELWETFQYCIEEAARQKIELLLIAGDLFHRQPSLQELQEVDYLFSTLENTLVVLIAGNHDYLKPSSMYLSFTWSSNVVTLFSEQCERVRFPDLRTEVYGFSYHQQELTEKLCDLIRPERSDYFKILLVHGGDASHVPLSRTALAASGFDYIALGHIHKPQIFINQQAWYAGALQPIDRQDTGPHGYVLGEVQHRHLKLSFVPVPGRMYLEREIEVERQDTAYSVREKLQLQIRRDGEANMYCFRLVGQRNPQLQFPIREYQKLGRILEIRDDTQASFPLEELSRKYQGQIVGDFIDSFSEKRSLVEEKALNYGLEALLYRK